uniref:Putative secreted protein n=1 Tax=Panstrongylus lignarius TaxID=156445 RepID=A0A224XZW1_9HEMI
MLMKAVATSRVAVLLKFLTEILSYLPFVSNSGLLAICHKFSIRFQILLLATGLLLQGPLQVSERLKIKGLLYSFSFLFY